MTTTVIFETSIQGESEMDKKEMVRASILAWGIISIFTVWALAPAICHAVANFIYFYLPWQVR